VVSAEFVIVKRSELVGLIGALAIATAFPPKGAEADALSRRMAEIVCESPGVERIAPHLTKHGVEIPESWVEVR
jgi:hypothetical protein